MLLKRDTLLGIRAGELDLAFRRWKSARVRAGTGLRTAIGVVEVVSIEPTSLEGITSSDARRAGFPARGQLLELLQGGLGCAPSAPVHDEPRIAIRKLSQGCHTRAAGRG